MRMPRNEQIAWGGFPRYTPPTDYAWEAVPANPIGPWRIFCGIHRGTLMSRDEGLDGERNLPDWDAVQARMRAIIADFHARGYAIWHASATAPDGRRCAILHGAPYDRDG
jgi:hypothetical protein